MIELTDPQVSVQNIKLLRRWNKTVNQYFLVVKNKQCPNSGLWFSVNLALTYPTLWECEIFLRENCIECCCHRSKQLFCFDDELLDETQMYGANNVHLIWVNTRKTADWISEHLPTSFQASCQINQSFNLIKKSANAIWNSCWELLMYWDKLLKMLPKSYRQQFNFQCVFRPLSEFILSSTSNFIKL